MANCEDPDHLANTLQFMDRGMFSNLDKEMPVVELEDQIIEESLSFGGETVIGKSSIGAHASYDACAYFSGYVANSMIKFHNRKLKSFLLDCQHCCNILIPMDFDLHLFVTFKEYTDEN